MPNLKMLPGPRIFRPTYYTRKLSNRVHPLCRDLWTLMKDHLTPKREVSIKSGVNEVTISGWFKTKTQTPNLQNIEACLGVFDLTMIAVPSEWLDPHMNTRSLRDVRALENMVTRAKAIAKTESEIEKTIRIREKSANAAY